MKRFISLMFILLFLLSISIEAAKPVRSVAYHQFTDVETDAWYYENVKTVCEYGLMNGKSASSFDPDGILTLVEAITIAARLHGVFSGNETEFDISDPWYVSYVEYARENGFLSDLYSIPTGDATFENTPDSSLGSGQLSTRLHFVVLINHAVPADKLKVINSIEDLSIPDVSQYWHQGEIDAVYKLYRAGILTGSDADGRFRGGESIKRSEVAAILSRIVESSLRKRIELKRNKGRVPITDDEAARLVGKQTTDPILQTFTADYDQNGKTEAFVVTGTEWEFYAPVTVWYVSDGRADQLFIGYYAFETSSLTYGPDDLDKITAFHFFCSYISYGNNRIWQVKNGKPCLIELSKDRVDDTDVSSALLYTVYDHPFSIITYDPDLKGYVAQTAGYQYSGTEGRGGMERVVEYHLLQYDDGSDSLVWTYTKLNPKDAWKSRGRS